MKTAITTISAGVFFALSLLAITPVHAATDWDVTGNYVIDFTCTFGCPAGPYSHDLSLTQDGSDALTGSGGHPAGGTHVYQWVLTSGSVTDDMIHFIADYIATADAVVPQTTMHVTGTIAGDGTMSGTWSDNYQGGSRGGTWVSTSGSAALTGGVAPIVSLVTTPSPVVAGLITTLTADVDDTSTGNSDIASAEYRITGGDWTAMDASDGAFDEPNEDVTVDFAFETPGVKEVCVRGADSAGNISTPSGDDCVLVSVIDPLTGYVSGGGNIKEGKKVVETFGGNVGYVPDVGLVGQLQVVDHTTKEICHYDNITHFEVEDGFATVVASGRCNGSPVADVELTYDDNGEPGTGDIFNSRTLAGGNIQVGGQTLGATTFTALDSAYYNGMNESDGLYGTGPITFTWDSDGTVTGGLWEEIVPPTTGTHYFNVVTSGTVIGNAVTLNLQRINPNAYGPFTIVGTFSGNVLTGTAAGPYLFTATGTITP